MCSEILKKKTKKKPFFNEMKLKKNLFVIEGAAKIGVVFFQVKDYEIIKDKVFLGAPASPVSCQIKRIMIIQGELAFNSQPAITCSKLTIETIEQGANYV